MNIWIMFLVLDSLSQCLPIELNKDLKCTRQSHCIRTSNLVASPSKSPDTATKTKTAFWVLSKTKNWSAVTKRQFKMKSSSSKMRVDRTDENLLLVTQENRVPSETNIWKIKFLPQATMHQGLWPTSSLLKSPRVDIIAILDNDHKNPSTGNWTRIRSP